MKNKILISILAFSHIAILKPNCCKLIEEVSKSSAKVLNRVLAMVIEHDQKHKQTLYHEIRDDRDYNEYDDGKLKSKLDALKVCSKYKS